MKEVYYPHLDERVVTHVAKNGLTVKAVLRPGFTKKMAYFVTDFGAIHTTFRWNGETVKVPAGIAHFLEHKMFELPDRDVPAEFAALGANVNAFTSYDMTAYHFSCSENFMESLRLLLEFVSTPYFPEDSVKREMGIIDQEIGMNEDAPESRVFEELMKQVFESHAIRVPILGSRESLRQITPALLETCHQAFYTPENMILCVVGDIDPQAVVELAEEVLGAEKKPVGEKIYPWTEKMAVCKPDFSYSMEVAMPLFHMAFKSEPAENGRQSMVAEIIGDLAAEMLFGESSALYLKMYENGWIDSSFGGGYETTDDGAMLTCGGDSYHATEIRTALLKEAQRLAENGISQGDFLRMKRSAMGRRIRDLDSFDSTCFRVCAYHFDGFDYFDFPDIYAQVTQEQVLEFLSRTVTKERCALAVIEPKEIQEVKL